jgi:DNA-binding beta-propeller fold protein YncE
MRTVVLLSVLAAAAAVVSCGSGPAPGPGPVFGPGNCGDAPRLSPTASTTPLSHRAYVVSRDSDDVVVIDLDRLEIMAATNTCGLGDHMAELSADFSKVYVDSPGTRESIVMDAVTLQVIKRIPLAAETTHLSLSRNGALLGIVNEWDDSVSFVDTAKDVEIKRLPGFYTPHFVRWAPDGRYAYVANLGAYHITRVDLSTLSIDAEIALDGHAVPPAPQSPIERNQNGFADVQIDEDGILWAAHGETGKVLVYDTTTRTKLPELTVGSKPWIVFAEHPFTQIKKHVVPNFGDQNVSLLDRAPIGVGGVVGGADSQSYGVNYSPLVPDRAFVMNRVKNEIAVIDTGSGQPVGTIPVGGTTETASTTADGKYIVAAVSSANKVVVIDAVTNDIVKEFDDVGAYPWSVTIPMGQNYCH